MSTLGVASFTKFSFPKGGHFVTYSQHTFVYTERDASLESVEFANASKSYCENRLELRLVTWFGQSLSNGGTQGMGRKSLSFTSKNAIHNFMPIFYSVMQIDFRYDYAPAYVIENTSDQLT